MAEKMLTECEAVLRERAAFERGAVWRFVDAVRKIDDAKTLTAISLPDNETYTNAAKKAFPLPKVTRPRVVRFNEFQFRVNTLGRIEFTGGPADEQWWDDAWPRFEHLALKYPKLLNAWYDLLANPTEEVEAES